MSDFKPTPEQSQALDDFKALCLADAAQSDPELKIDPGEELDWFAMSLGFFLARGLSLDAAHAAALHARYEFHYWMD